MQQNNRNNESDTINHKQAMEDEAKKLFKRTLMFLTDKKDIVTIDRTIKLESIGDTEIKLNFIYSTSSRLCADIKSYLRKNSKYSDGEEESKKKPKKYESEDDENMYLVDRVKRILGKS